MRSDYSSVLTADIERLHCGTFVSFGNCNKSFHISLQDKNVSFLHIDPKNVVFNFPKGQRALTHSREKMVRR
jgi:hypothetical protein